MHALICSFLRKQRKLGCATLGAGESQAVWKLEGRNGSSSPPCLLTPCHDLAWWEADRCVLDTRSDKGLTFGRSDKGLTALFWNPRELGQDHDRLCLACV